MYDDSDSTPNYDSRLSVRPQILSIGQDLFKALSSHDDNIYRCQKVGKSQVVCARRLIPTVCREIDVSACLCNFPVHSTAIETDPLIMARRAKNVRCCCFSAAVVVAIHRWEEQQRRTMAAPSTTGNAVIRPAIIELMLSSTEPTQFQSSCYRIDIVYCRRASSKPRQQVQNTEAAAGNNVDDDDPKTRDNLTVSYIYLRAHSKKIKSTIQQRNRIFFTISPTLRRSDI
jgi:hypothetical protein